MVLTAQCYPAQTGKKVFLKGTLDIQIIEGKDLPNLDNSWFTSKKNVSDPYVTVDLTVGGTSTRRLAKTSVIKDSLNPQWNTKFRSEVCNEAESILFHVKDKDLLTADNMGSLSIQAEDLLTEKPITGFFPLMNNKGKSAGSLNLCMHYTFDKRKISNTALPMKIAPKVVLLRGYLHVSLLEAKDLPDLDKKLFFVSKDKSDPFAQVRIGDCVLCKTFYVNNDLSPMWQESFKVPICHESDEVHIEVLDKDFYSEGLLGKITLKAEDLLGGEEMNGWYPLADCNGRIKIYLKYQPKDDLKNVFEVPDCYFPMREGCRLKLYQDAHYPPLPIYKNVPSDADKVYDAPCVWKDLSHDLNNAKKFIYMTGWNVSTKCQLKRQGHDKNEGCMETVGELLKRKAKEGVRVLIMVWDEIDSTGLTSSCMNTHDVETRDYFKASEVEVALVPRVLPIGGLAEEPASSFIKDQLTQACYSHHQRTLIMDTPAADGAKKQTILAYIGSLDVTDKEDFYNNCVDTTPEVGPRQPWHDINARVEGPVAKDVLDNFTERWRHQVKEKEYRLLPMGDELDFSALAEVEEGSEWNAQLFRSITSDSAAFDLNRIQYVPKRKIKNVDDSILRAYIHHIRKADHFMFFENQYFLGSAFNWEDEATTKAHHLIPQEITHRICDKISAGEHIVAYIIIPIHPEGDPTTDAMQAILHCQHRTMEMMYKKIATTIKKKKMETKPTDYLTFFCLGKEECSDVIPAELPKPEPGTPGARLRETARFMIYVHSKIMIIDDDYILVGSANINQRSMVGTKETEIAVGAYQPLHTSEVSGYPRGSVHQFRMALWAEHLNGVEEVHANPGTLECVKAVNQLATKNWEQFVTDEPCHITGHLLHYPVNVNDDGSVTALKDFPNFPNTEAPILGAPILESRPKAYYQMKTHHSHPIVNKISQISQPITAVSVPYREQHDWAK